MAAETSAVTVFLYSTVVVVVVVKKTMMILTAAFLPMTILLQILQILLMLMIMEIAVGFVCQYH
jgi:hypothetical protein